MTPKAHILDWAAKTPWPEEQQVEQDLLICRALVAIFSDDFLRSRLASRRGTALNKLFFSGSYRYSEDIDLVQTTPEPIGPTIDALRNALDPWLGRGAYQAKAHSHKMIYKVQANGGGVMRLKVEINTREHTPHFQHMEKPFFDGKRVVLGRGQNQDFSGRRDSLDKIPGAASMRQGPRRLRYRPRP